MVGIMGGTFNPIHNGHIWLAQQAYERLGLEKVIFIPSGNSYMKQNVLDAQNRAAMVKLAISDFEHFELSMAEVERKGNTYTFETLEALKVQNPDVKYCLLIGADLLFQIESWYKPEKIFELSTIVCAVRDDYDIMSIRQKGAELSRLGADIVYLDIPKCDISSTEIRNRVGNDMPIDEIVPKKVADYILCKNLYKKNIKEL